MRTVSINLDTLDVQEDAPAFADVDRATLKAIDAFIAGEAMVNEDEVADLDAILADFAENPFG